MQLLSVQSVQRGEQTRLNVSPQFVICSQKKTNTQTHKFEYSLEKNRAAGHVLTFHQHLSTAQLLCFSETRIYEEKHWSHRNAILRLLCLLHHSLMRGQREDGYELRQLISHLNLSPQFFSYCAFRIYNSLLYCS